MEIGQKFLRFFTEIGGLQPHHKVLDIGSGNGRMAYPLRDFLEAEKGAEYHGQEIVKKAVEWCKQAYSAYPAFHFFHADIVSKRYNPKGNCLASEYRFPFDDNYFNFIFLTSVFTHMLRDDVNQYLKEISRLLKPGARCFITAFLLDHQNLQLLNEGVADMNFVPFKDGMYSTRPDNPESAVAFPLEGFRQMLEDAGLQLHGDIHFGRWSGRKEHLAYQDILVVERMKSETRKF